jgi:tellurite resistance protein TerC
LFDELTFWIVFAVIAAIIIFIDLYVTDHRHGKLGLKRSLMWSGVWISTALLFNAFIYFYAENGHVKGLEFLTGYLIEYSLSVDNLFVFLMIFRVMNISHKNQPHVLKWGILSAIVFRVIFILAGVSLINLFHPVIYLFAIILFFAAYKMAFGGEGKIDYEKNPLIKLIKKFFNILPEYDGKKFFVKREGKIFATSLLLTLLLIESSDIVFAVDSIPAVIAITRDPFIIITSNIFAVLGLRALYFSLSGIVNMFYYLKYGVAIILLFVGIKMILTEFVVIPTHISLAIIIICLAGSIILSLFHKKVNSSSNHKDE